MRLHIIIFFFLLSFFGLAQVANYVNNPSFESYTLDVNMSTFDVAKYWKPLHSSGASYILHGKPPLGGAPYLNFGFQYPKSGNNLILSQFYCTSCPRWYPRNQLKQTLKPNTTYCAKYYVVNTNNNRVAIDTYGMYFGNSSMDTITKCQIPLTYLTPQIENQTGIITDTLNWIPITGTFVANGTEKYMVLGNFKSNAATNTLLLNPTLTVMSNDVYIDDVSLIELELPAFAGRDTSVIPGDSIFLGREPDIGIDEVCMWYKLPTVITSTTPALDTIAGFWIKPVTSCTYIVRQQLWCSGVKWDTVVVHMNPVGLEKLKLISSDLSLSPNPAQDAVNLRFTYDDINEFKFLSIYNSIGQLIRREELIFEDKRSIIDTRELENGVYTFSLSNTYNDGIVKKLVIAR